MATLTAATASSRPRDPQLMMRVRTPSRQTLEDKEEDGCKSSSRHAGDWSAAEPYPIRVLLEFRIRPNRTRRQMSTSNSSRPRYPNHLHRYPI